MRVKSGPHRCTTYWASANEPSSLCRIVAGSDDTQTMQSGQYEIGPVTARDWAKQRLESPFTRL